MIAYLRIFLTWYTLSSCEEENIEDLMDEKIGRSLYKMLKRANGLNKTLKSNLNKYTLEKKMRS